MQRIEFQPLPETRVGPELAGQLAVFAETDMPALAVRQAGATIDEALATIEPHLPTSLRLPRITPELDYDLVVQDITDIDTGLYEDDIGLHIDLDDKEPTPGTVVNAWHLERGAVRASYLLPGPDVLRRLRADRRVRPLLPSESKDAFLHGFVLPNQLSPKAYQTNLAAGDLVLSKDGHPLAHDYTTTGFAGGLRVAHARLGRIDRPSLLDRFGFA